MTDKIKKPRIVANKHLIYLDNLRESGETNMYGAGAYVERKFMINSKDADTIVGYWMKTFGERQAKNTA